MLMESHKSVPEARKRSPFEGRKLLYDFLRNVGFYLMFNSPMELDGILIKLKTHTCVIGHTEIKMKWTGSFNPTDSFHGARTRLYKALERKVTNSLSHLGTSRDLRTVKCSHRICPKTQ